MSNDSVQLPVSWKNRLIDEFQKPYMQKLRAFLMQEMKLNKRIYPAPKQYFSAFNEVDFEEVKVVILGQDPYHGYGQAHGLCFSVPVSTSVPPSLKNIFQEIHSDLGIKPPKHGCLVSWARQGVLLLNATLTVEAGKAGSHQNKGWELFTDRIVHLLNTERDSLVFMLWGRYAQEKGAFIDINKHLVLKAPHPSPFSADRGFFGCSHFSKANKYLEEKGKKTMDWSLPEI